MIFAHTIDKVLDGTKRQTRRIVKANEFWDGGDTIDICKHELKADVYGTLYHADGEYVLANKRVKWRIGGSYSVQPGRGQKAVARIRITGIRCEDVRNISDADVKAEGFSSLWDFWQTWTKMHDRSFKFWFDPSIVDYGYKIGREQDIVGWHTLQQIMRERPDERYQAWVLEFELVESEKA